MSDTYSISLSIYQTNPTRGLFSIVEKNIWNYAEGGTWSETDGIHTLTMGGSGTSGTLRLMGTQGGVEYVLFAVGVDHSKPWCDIVPNLKAAETGTVVNGWYYNDGPRASIKEKQWTECSVTSAVGTKYVLTYTVSRGNNLAANIIIE